MSKRLSLNPLPLLEYSGSLSGLGKSCNEQNVILLAMFMLFSVSAWAQSSQQPPPLALKDIRGRLLSLSEYKGKVVLVNFWPTWCIPCRTEIPDLIKKQRQHRNQGLRIIGITYPPELLSEVRRYVQKFQMNYRIAMGTKATKTPFTASETLPMTVVIDREGVARDVIEGIMYADELARRSSLFDQSEARQL